MFLVVRGGDLRGLGDVAGLFWGLGGFVVWELQFAWRTDYGVGVWDLVVEVGAVHVLAFMGFLWVREYACPDPVK